MSYLSQLKNNQITIKEFLAKSVGYIHRKLGLTLSDEKVDEVVEFTDDFTDRLEELVAWYIKSKVPFLPAQELATSAASSVLNHIDAAIAGAGAVIKENN